MSASADARVYCGAPKTRAQFFPPVQFAARTVGRPQRPRPPIAPSAARRRQRAPQARLVSACLVSPGRHLVLTIAVRMWINTGERPPPLVHFGYTPNERAA